MFWLILSVSDKVSSGVWRPTKARSVAWAISLIAAEASRRHHRADRIRDAVVGDRRDVDADVVAGDDPLRLDGHGDDAKRVAVNAIDEGTNTIRPGPARHPGHAPA